MRGDPLAFLPINPGYGELFKIDIAQPVCGVS